MEMNFLMEMEISSVLWKKTWGRVQECRCITVTSMFSFVELELMSPPMLVFKAAAIETWLISTMAETNSHLWAILTVFSESCMPSLH